MQSSPVNSKSFEVKGRWELLWLNKDLNMSNIILLCFDYLKFLVSIGSQPMINKLTLKKVPKLLQEQNKVFFYLRLLFKTLYFVISFIIWLFRGKTFCFYFEFWILELNIFHVWRDWLEVGEGKLHRFSFNFSHFKLFILISSINYK